MRVLWGGLLAGCFVAAVLIAVGPTRTAPVAPEVTRTESVRVLQMNLCNSGLAACYTGRAVAVAAEVIRAQSPDVVTLNEVCRSDVDVLGAGFGASAFRPALDRRTGAAFRCRNGEPYGIAVLTRRPMIGSEGGAYPRQNPADPEERVWLCVETSGLAACTTHLDATNAAVARAQCDHLVDTVLPARPAPAVLGGDFNLRSEARRCLAAGGRADDGGVQNVVVSAPFAITGVRRIDMRATTDHPGLLVTLTHLRTAAAASVV
jgi:endonuclease/exonuclease/phosphatase (EEP) superfamily protein YafD